MEPFRRPDELEKALLDCRRRLDAGASLQECIERYPKHAAAIEAHFGLAHALAQAEVAGPSASASWDGRRALLSTLDATPARRGAPLLSPARGMATALGIGALVLVTAGTGASAAGFIDPPRPVAQVLNTLGIESSEHGKAVSDGVRDAIDSTSPGPERGKAVSEKACANAQERGNLPDGAQQAPGRADKEPKDCSHPNSDGTPGNAPDAAPQGAQDEDTPGRGNPPGRGGPPTNPGQNQPAGEDADGDTPGPRHTPPANPGQGPPQTVPPAR